MTGLWDRAQIAEPPILRGYQQDAVDRVVTAYRNGARAPLLALATGAGKTVIASELIRRTGEPALFLAPRRELVFQASNSLARAGVDHGVVMAGREDLENQFAPVTVASLDTVLVRCLKRDRRPFPDPALIVVDEAHLSITQRRQDLLGLWPQARRLGLTATPGRKDGKALGLLYDRLIEPVTVADLTEAGWLVPARYFAPATPDLAGVATLAGDYHQRQLEERVDRADLVGDIVQTWLERAGGRRTVVFAASIAHSVHLVEAFQRQGVAAEHVDARTPTAERSAIFGRFTRGETQVLGNCFLAAYGFDLPELSCVVLARPTKSLVLYLQMLGRGLRIADNKEDCLVLDHSGAVHRHGFAADDRIWTLDGDRMLEEPKNRPHEAAEPITCPECAAVFVALPACPECGHRLRPAGREVRTLAGELIEIGQGLPSEDVDRQVFHRELLGICRERGYKDGFAAHKFRERFGSFPPRWWSDLEPLQPTVTTRRWLRSRNIAWARSQRRRAG